MKPSQTFILKQSHHWNVNMTFTLLRNILVAKKRRVTARRSAGGIVSRIVVFLWTINGETESRRHWNCCASIRTNLANVLGSSTLISFIRAWNAPNCWLRAIHVRTHHRFRFSSFSFFSSSSICCSTANAPSKIACSSMLLLQLSAIAVCVCNGLHLMTSLTRLSRPDCFATTTCVMHSYESIVRVSPP